MIYYHLEEVAKDQYSTTIPTYFRRAHRRCRHRYPRHRECRRRPCLRLPRPHRERRRCRHRDRLEGKASFVSLVFEDVRNDFLREWNQFTPLEG